MTFLLGCFVGALVGLFIGALARTAAQADREADRLYHDLQERATLQQRAPGSLRNFPDAL